MVARRARHMWAALYRQILARAWAPASLNLIDAQWTVLYDEIVYVIDGVFIVKTNYQTYTAQKGEVVWIPKGTELSYQGEEARIFYVVYPGN